MQPCPEDFWKFAATSKNFSGINNSLLPVKSGVKVTDILVRGGGGTITFSDGVNVEYLYGFIPDSTVPGGGRFGVNLEGPRAQLVYQTVLQQNMCDTIDWLLECSDLNRRVSILELLTGQASEFTFAASDWTDGTVNQIHIPNEGPLVPGDIGPHEYGTNRSFHLNVWRSDGSPIIVGVDLEVSVNLVTGLIRLIKAPLAPTFSGRVIIS
tara:strand:+ start:31353 stop:31982 length:630 start_codon:yes stop_codon:yes gene_type:complete